MSEVLAGNGNGEGDQQLRALEEMAHGGIAPLPADVKESLVTGQTADGLALHGVPKQTDSGATGPSAPAKDDYHFIGHDVPLSVEWHF
jgi:hypothetical protein